QLSTWTRAMPSTSSIRASLIRTGRLLKRKRAGNHVPALLQLYRRCLCSRFFLFRRCFLGGLFSRFGGNGGAVAAGRAAILAFGGTIAFNQLDHGHRRVVAIAEASFQNAGIAALTVFIAGCKHVKQ